MVRLRRACRLLVVILTPGLAGCVAPDQTPTGAALLNPGGGDVLSGQGAPPAPGSPASGGRAIALLAPLNGPNAERGDALVKAAQLALAEPGSPPLDVRDTGGTAPGAAAAARAAIAAGDGLILGPLSAAETAAVAGAATAAGVPVLAFTNDSTQARPGLWVLGLTPAQQVRRLVMATAAQGKTRFAALLPQGDFGQAMAAALRAAVEQAGGSADIRFHDDGNAAIAAAMRDISGYDSRGGPIYAQIKTARQKRDARLAADLARQPIPPPAFDALLLADIGDKLAWLSTFLSYYDIDAPAVRVLGPALWAQPAARAGAAIDGAWYAAPDPAVRVGFDQLYAAKYGAPAPGLADLAFDAASIGRVLAASGGYAVTGLCRPDGFAGVDGVLTLQPDGGVRRALAVFEAHRGGSTLADPAPTTLLAPGL